MPLTILFNLVKDPAEYLRLIGPELALQILLTNPLTPAGLVDILVEVVSSLEIDVLDDWFNAMKYRFIYGFLVILHEPVQG
jgi:hypothetical protein